MDTLEFLKTLLPKDGVKFLALQYPNKRNPAKPLMIHEPFYELSDMADRIKECAAKKISVYHACSSYKEVKYKKKHWAEGEYVVGRDKSNVLASKALWLDFDVGKSASHAYKSREEAIAELKMFIKETRIGMPMVIRSGNGIHVYFLFDEAIPPEEWNPLVHLLRQALRVAGVRFDPSSDQDSARILRPVGSYNLKDTSNPILVKAANSPFEMHSASVYKQRLEAYLERKGVEVEFYVPENLNSDLNSDLIVNPEYPKSSAVRIAKFCKQMREFSENGGIDEPTWYAAIGVLKHCIDGEEVLHEWSGMHPDYTEGSTDRKYEQWEAGPTTCERFRGLNPDGCAGCTQKCKSPIQLGQEEPENVPHVPVEIAEAPEELVHMVGQGSPYWPDGYVIRNGALEVARRGEDDIIKHVQIVKPAFWITEEVFGEKGEILYQAVAEIKSGKQRTFEIPAASTSSIDKLKTALASSGVHVVDFTVKAGWELMSFLQQQVTRMSQIREETNTFRQMGWTDDFEGYLCGTQLITKDTTRTVRVAREFYNIFKDFSKVSEKSGDQQGYVDGVNKLYARPGRELYQYAFSSVFGSTLSPLMRQKDWHGIPLVLYSKDSGFGKSTVAAVAFNGLCNHTGVRVDNSTYNGYIRAFSRSGSFPVFFDEITGKLSPEYHVNLLYAASQGADKIRMNSQGGVQENLPAWNTMAVLTTNSNVLFSLSESPTNPDAASCRLVHIDMQQYLPKNDFSDEDKDLAQHLTDHFTGVLAEDFIRYIIKNKDKVTEYLETENRRITKALPSTINVKARFLTRHAACTIVGAALLKSLFGVKFEIAEMRRFIVNHLRSMLDEMRDYQPDANDVLGAMLADLHPNILVTERYDTLVGKEREMVNQHIDTVVGRYATGCSGGGNTVSDAGRLYIAATAIRNWCSKRKLSFVETRHLWMSAGLIETNRGSSSDGYDKVYLNRGVPGIASTRQRCMEFNVLKVGGQARELLGPKVVPMPISSEAAKNADQSHDQSQAM